MWLRVMCWFYFTDSGCVSLQIYGIRNRFLEIPADWETALESHNIFQLMVNTFVLRNKIDGIETPGNNNNPQGERHK